MDLEFKAASLCGNGLKATYIDELNNEVSISSDKLKPVHEDFKNALKKLIPFFCDICELADSKPLDWDHPFDQDPKVEAAINSCIVTGVKKTGSFEHPKYILIGKRNLTSGKVLQINSPAIGVSIEDEEYSRCESLGDAIEVLFFEAEEYINNGKYQKSEPTLFDNAKDDPFAEEIASSTEDA